MVKFTTFEYCLMGCLIQLSLDNPEMLNDLRNIVTIFESIEISTKTMHRQLLKIADKVEFHKIKSLAV